MSAFSVGAQKPLNQSFLRETLIKSLDKLRAKGKLLIPFMVYSTLVVEPVEP
jgi:hypothetical protein